MLNYALRNLLQNKMRLTVSLGGVALALALILSFDAIVEGAQRRLTAYMDQSGADLFVSQAGVRTMHMSASTLPASAVDAVRAVPGVAAAEPILYLTNMVGAGEGRYLAYVIGVAPDATMGAAWQVVEGQRTPGRGEAVIDRTVADESGVGVGGRVKILGQDLTVAGLSDGTANIVNSIAFIAFDDFARVRGGPPVVSYILVRTAPGESPGEVAARVEAALPGATVQTRQAFAAQERRLTVDMMTDVISVMNSVGFLIGLAVLALTVYVATFAKRAEYGMLKALGAANRDLYLAVVAQAVYSVVLGFLSAVVLTLLLVLVVPRAVPAMSLAIAPGSLVKVAAASALIAMAAAALPVRQVAGVDPAVVFRGG